MLGDFLEHWAAQKLPICVFAGTQELMSFFVLVVVLGGGVWWVGVPVCHLQFKKWVKQLSGVSNNWANLTD